MEWEQLVNDGIEARQRGDGAAWELGDLSLQVETHYGEGDLAKYASRVGLANKSLLDYRRVSLRFEMSERSDILTWSHHRVVAARDDAEAWLERAEREGWTVEQLREATSGLMSSESSEWYTPRSIIERTVKLLGAIDLDPCSDGITVPAKRHYTAADDGLSKPWRGRVYMNPPYGDEIRDWVVKLRQEHEAGRTKAAVALVPARTDTQWWAELRDYPVCFIRGRLKFSGHENSAPFPSAVFYLAPMMDEFCDVFDDMGDVYVRVES